MFKTLPTIQIGGHTYTVELVDRSIINLSANHCGDSYLGSTSINVCTKLHDGTFRALSDMEETLIHEIVHQINDMWVIGLDEDNVERMSQGFLQVFKQYGLKLIDQIEDIRG